MAYVTALGFVLCGFGLLSYARGGQRVLPAAAGIAVFALALGWMGEHVLGFPIGWLVLEEFLPVIPGRPPGRPSFATMSCFGFFGAALAVLGLPLSPSARRASIWILGALALAPYLAVAGSSLSGFLKAEEWSALHGMAPGSLVGFFLLGVGLLAVQGIGGSRLLDDRFLPWPVFVVLASTAVLYWQALDLGRNLALRRGATETAKNLAANSLLSAEAPLRALDRIKARWDFHGRMSYEEWKLDADAHLGSEDILSVIELADASGKIVWCRPEAKSPQSLGFDIWKDPRWDAAGALKESLETRARVTSGTIDLRQGGSGFIAYWPLFDGDRFEGWLIGIIRIDRLMTLAIKAANLDGGNVAIFENGTLIAGGPLAVLPPTFGEATADFNGREWRFVVVPDEKRSRAEIFRC